MFKGFNLQMNLLKLTYPYNTKGYLFKNVNDLVLYQDPDPDPGSGNFRLNYQDPDPVRYFWIRHIPTSYTTFLRKK